MVNMRFLHFPFFVTAPRLRAALFFFVNSGKVTHCKSRTERWMIREALTRKFVIFIYLYNYSIFHNQTCSSWRLVIGEVTVKCLLYFTKSDLIRRHLKLSFRRHLAGFVNTFTYVFYRQNDIFRATQEFFN